MVVISSAGRFDRKLAGVGDAESAGINCSLRNLSAKGNRGASINNHTACNANPPFLKLSLNLVGMLGDKLPIDPLKQIGDATQKRENKPKEKAEE